MNPIVAAILRGILTTAGLIVTPWPRGLELRLGTMLGHLFLFFDPKRKPIARENISRCLPELSPAQRERLLRENYEHYGVLLLELLHIFSPIPGHFRRYTARHTVIEGLENWRRAHAKGRGTIIVTAHLANWEMMGQAGVEGVPCLMVTRRLKPDWFNDRVVAARRSLEVETAYGERIMPRLLRHLKKGKAVGFVLDQYAPPPSVPATFFGAKVGSQSAVGLLVERTEAAVVPVLQRRDENGVIHIRFEPELELTAAQLADPVLSTEALLARIESWIRETPAQWLWVHRRFKNAAWPVVAFRT